LGDDFFNNLNMQCEEMKENGFTMKGFSKEYVERTDGKDKADAVYTQDKDRKISKISQEITSDIHKVVLEMIKHQGVAIEKEVLEVIRSKYRNKGFTERKYKQAISEMIDMYELKRKRLTKTMRKEFGLNLPPKSMPTVLIKAS